MIVCSLATALEESVSQKQLPTEMAARVRNINKAMGPVDRISTSSGSSAPLGQSARPAGEVAPAKRQKMVVSRVPSVPSREELGTFISEQDFSTMGSQIQRLHTRPDAGEFWQSEHGSAGASNRKSHRHRRSKNLVSTEAVTPLWTGMGASLPSTATHSDDISEDELLRASSTITAPSCPENRPVTNRMIDGGDTRFTSGNSYRRASDYFPRRKNKKRHKEEISDSGDELDGLTAVTESSRATKTLADARHRSSKSTCSLGSIESALPFSAAAGRLLDNHFSICAALCQPGHAYISVQADVDTKTPKSDPNCYLEFRQNEVSPVFADDGAPVGEKLSWLRISYLKINHVLWDSDLKYIKLDRLPQSEIRSGPMLLLQFLNKDESRRFAGLLSERVGHKKVQRQAGSGLQKIWQHQSATITQAHRQGRRQKLTTSTSPSPWPSAVVPSCPPPGRHAASSLRSESPQQTSIFIVESKSATMQLSRRSLRSRQAGTHQGSDFRPASSDPPRWTEKHPDWAEKTGWKLPLTWKRQMVEKKDIERLDEGACLNDNLIGFGLRYYFEQIADRANDLANRVFLHNSFFYEKLSTGKGKSNINYDGVKSWTAKNPLLDKDFVVVPVNEHFHWWVAIICNPGNLDRSNETRHSRLDGEAATLVERGGRHTNHVAGPEALDAARLPTAQMDHLHISSPHQDFNGSSSTVDAGSKEDDAVTTIASTEVRTNSSQDVNSARKGRRKHSGPPPKKFNLTDSRIITLDSLGTSHSPACTNLRHYLVHEFRDKKKTTIQVPDSLRLGLRALDIPQQNNFCDCGVYLLGYFKEFVKDPDSFVRGILQRERCQWKIDAPSLRNELREIIFELYDQQLAGRREKKRAKISGNASQQRSKNANARPSANLEAARSPARLVNEAVPTIYSPTAVTLPWQTNFLSLEETTAPSPKMWPSRAMGASQPAGVSRAANSSPPFPSLLPPTSAYSTPAGQYRQSTVAPSEAPEDGGSVHKTTDEASVTSSRILPSALEGKTQPAPEKTVTVRQNPREQHALVVVRGGVCLGSPKDKFCGLPEKDVPRNENDDGVEYNRERYVKPLLSSPEPLNTFHRGRHHSPQLSPADRPLPNKSSGKRSSHHVDLTNEDGDNGLGSQRQTKRFRHEPVFVL